MKNVRIIQELKRIRQSSAGILLPEDVVRVARNPKSILHPRFEWDDTKAAHEHRLWQARQLISICVEVIPGITEPVQVFTSLSIDRGQGGGYRVTAEICKDENLRSQMLNDALHDLNCFQAKYQHLRELAAVFSAIDKVQKKVA